MHHAAQEGVKGWLSPTFHCAYSQYHSCVARTQVSSMKSQQLVLYGKMFLCLSGPSEEEGTIALRVSQMSRARSGARSRAYLACVCLHGGPVLRGHHAPCAAAVALHPLIRLGRGRHSWRCAWRRSRRLAVGCGRARLRAGSILRRRHLLRSTPSFTFRACSSASVGLARSTLPFKAAAWSPVEMIRAAK